MGRASICACDDRHTHRERNQEVFVALLIERTAPMIGGMSMPEDASESVIRQLMEGRFSEEKFRCLFEKYHHAVSSFFFRKGFCTEDRRDLCLEVFVAVHQGITNLRSEDSFLPWLFAIANHVALRHWERERARPRLQFAFSDSDAETSEQSDTIIDRLAASDPDPEHRMLELEKVRRVEKTLEELPGKMRMCLKYRYYDGMTNIEIAEKLGISESTVAVHIHRGIESLRLRLDQYFEKQPFAGNF
ncbi:MAG TPA: RNA polymerase sigma factor [Candidatus Angelobacter sp.]|jgi:RNA polymerase sigma-70 factor (ECF subfamily)|nr:RNA polymerase sigma factor [Candidatus Angelobacter sp.]